MPDIDIDLADRTKLLNLVEHYPASRIDKDQLVKHNVGIYFQEIPIDEESGLASIPYEEAEERGWQKLDFINNTIYRDLKSEEHLIDILNRPVEWELFKIKDIVENLAHINTHSDLVVKYEPKSIEEIAMIIALVRPGKVHLIGKSFDEIKDEIWVPTEKYYFKKAHAIAYAMSIIVQLQLMIEKSNN